LQDDLKGAVFLCLSRLLSVAYPSKTAYLQGMTKKIMIIAGEASGDLLGARLMTALKQHANEPLHFSGVFGTQMQEIGGSSLFPMEDLSVMGIAEVLPHIPKILKHLKTAVDHVISTQPDVVITIDSPGFSFRLAKKLKALKNKGKLKVVLIHYVAPSVWAWKPKRAEKIALLYDKLLTLLPFEPHYFTPHGLATTFVGHPLVELELPPLSQNTFRTTHNISPYCHVLALLAGSRKGEITKLLPVFLETAERLAKRYAGLQVVLPTLPHLVPLLKKLTQHSTLPLHITSDPAEKYLALQTATVALAASGTVSLELALCQTPTVIGYRLNALTAAIVKRVVRVKYVSIINLLLDKQVFPEHLQENCTVENLTNAVQYYLDTPAARDAFQQDCQRALAMLYPEGGISPSEKAAAVVLGKI
jgi:lipid-A-disaccharide synthase